MRLQTLQFAASSIKCPRPVVACRLVAYRLVAPPGARPCTLIPHRQPICTYFPLADSRHHRSHLKQYYSSLTSILPQTMAQRAELLDGHAVPPPERLADTLERPELDNRTYRVIKLENELEALLIHDPDTDKASAALDMNVGSFSDPDDMPGMAHAVEHLLFMGTKKVRGGLQVSCRSL
jgi:hypothetical protein